MRAKPSTYTDEVGEAICERMIKGESLRSICSDPAMPSLSGVFKWLKAGHMVEQYAVAREIQAHVYAEETREIADEEGDPNRARVRVDQRKWHASKLYPKVYGDQMRHTGKDDEPLFPPLAQMTEEQLRAELVKLRDARPKSDE